ncbi:MAG TPA: flagellar filament capping protein FliD [Azospira sp.]|nr:flagellar filament capping protein FliD [Azospira sp.]
MAVSATGFSAGSVSALSGAQGDRVSAALRRPAERLAQEAESTRVRLSAFGQAQSATAAVQTASRTLQDARQISSAADARKAAETFAQAFNAERAALASASGNGSAGAAAVPEGARASIGASQLERVVADNATAFRDAGIRVQQDGSLTVDAKALEAAYATNPSAVTQALGAVGRAAEATATRQLGSNGSIGAAVNNLNTRLQQLETRQENVRVRADESQRAVEASARRYGFGAVGAGAYLGIFGL